jgi:hypothetical protein
VTLAGSPEKRPGPSKLDSRAMVRWRSLTGILP